MHDILGKPHRFSQISIYRSTKTNSQGNKKVTLHTTLVSQMFHRTRRGSRVSSHQREPGNRSTESPRSVTHQTVHVILFPRRQRATTASAWRQLGVPSCTSASGCPWYQDNTSPKKVVGSVCAKTRERRGKEQERRRGSTERTRRGARSVERRYTEVWKGERRVFSDGWSERERSLLVSPNRDVGHGRRTKG